MWMYCVLLIRLASGYHHTVALEGRLNFGVTAGKALEGAVMVAEEMLHLLVSH